MFFVVLSHYQRLQNVVLLLQACLLHVGGLGLSCTLLLQQLHRLHFATGPSLLILCEYLQLLFEDRQCCKLLKGKVEKFSQFHSCCKDGLATFLCDLTFFIIAKYLKIPLLCFVTLGLGILQF